MAETLIRTEHLKKSYGNVTPLKDVNVSINKGDVISIIGPSGTGKSTFLRMMNQLEKVTSGKIFYRDEEITAPNYRLDLLRQKIGMIFQSFNLFPQMTVIENIIAAPIELKGMTKQEAFDKAAKLLKRVGLYEKLLSYPDELSGGQQQRIAIVRALIMEPEILLFDEPTSALDPTMVGEVEAVIRKISESGTTMMIVTHGMDFAKQISNRIFYMDDGGIYEEGTPDEIFESPKREKTRQFIKRLKVLELVINSQDFDFIAYTNQIKVFADKNNLPKKVLNNLTLLFEEICMVNLLPRLGDNPKIRVTIEYSAQNLTADMLIDYNGEQFNLDDGDDKISLKMIHRVVSRFDYRAELEGDFLNHLKLTPKTGK